MQRHVAVSRILDTGIVGILRGVPAEQTHRVVDALVAGGVTTLEVTADTPGAIDTIDHLTDAFDREDALIGVGTVLDSETASAALRAGADFVVTPSFDRGVVETCNRHGVAVAPGVATPTEAVEASEAGADLLKVFPAGPLGPDYVGAIGGPLGQLPLLPTGGVSLDNVADFFDAGAGGVGVGSSLVDGDAVEREDYAALTERAEQFREAIESARE
ncbi:bifunctional 4-hydroxy-2-oxoglutarate aldolase/2-dehydro-3-deoxy-phosphogluconate aldolase [Salinirubrum litoreum]|uniref:Bifunctional 4-hydroxy-2-oxoglutarate aldolase/2-dehydro-3-deoxy-phosphogluconate aldolase n=1 Tax=Salinirubrum litoreum TaxID=1126234 RepID=A0ABD5RFL6_9EURY|nr:bifunctional 4-hydroxy-2-oxoglutarate aldolase/2-dehydro-3-deoxy-phosphogluconate aldolase [Salinirubrum litoreum]